MKKLLSVFLAFSLIAISYNSQAQTRTSVVRNINQGEYIDFGGINLIPSDSLQVTDTIAYIIPISHINEVWPYYTWYWNNLGAGTASVTVSFYQGNDLTNFFPVKAGVAQTSYSKAYTLSANTWSEIDFARDTARVNGRYLKVQLLTTSTANVKGKIFNRMKTYFK